VGTRAESSGEEIYDTGFQIIHRTGHLYRAIRLHFSEHGAVLANVSYRDFHILARDSIMGRKHREQASLFYEFRLDDMIPKGHLLRRINVFVTSVLGDLRGWYRFPGLQHAHAEKCRNVRSSKTATTPRGTERITTCPTGTTAKPGHSICGRPDWDLNIF
jgi:hypothetical protein